MKITFILPAIGKKPGVKYIKTWKMEPLSIASLKAITPLHYQTEFFDDRIELIDYQTATDIVAISLETYTALRAYRIAEKFRARGIPVIMGGYHATLLPEEVSEHADAVVVGNAEKVWAQLLHDAENHNLQKIYNGGCGFGSVAADRSIYADKKYLALSLLETGRGCPFRCEFCAISSYYQSRYYTRPVAQVIEEIVALGKKKFFFVDDNIIANPGYAIELFEKMAPLKIQWGGQGSLTIADNPKLLAAMAKSGCKVLLIGFESLDHANLKQMGKEWEYKLGNPDELVARIHDHGINIYATFIFGNDHDTRHTFDQALEFSLKHQFFFAAFNHLLVLPGTPVYERIKAEGRLISEKWWLDPQYRYGMISFRPKNMSAEEVSDACAAARRQFFSSSNIFKRGLALWGRQSSLMLALVYFFSNFTLQHEVDGKLQLPLGDGLDELPK